jgi:hypothetical protein
VPKGQQIDQLKPKQYSNCLEPNKPDSKFCAKCRMVLTYDAYNETLENQKEKEDRLSVMEQQFSSMQSQLKAVISSLTDLDQSGRNEIALRMYHNGVYKILANDQPKNTSIEHKMHRT